MAKVKLEESSLAKEIWGRLFPKMVAQAMQLELVREQPAKTARWSVLYPMIRTRCLADHVAKHSTVTTTSITRTSMESARTTALAPRGHCFDLYRA